MLEKKREGEIFEVTHNRKIILHFSPLAKKGLCRHRLFSGAFARVASLRNLSRALIKRCSILGNLCQKLTDKLIYFSCLTRRNRFTNLIAKKIEIHWYVSLKIATQLCLRVFHYRKRRPRIKQCALWVEKSITKILVRY